MRTLKFYKIIALFCISLNVFSQNWDQVKHITGPGNIDLRVIRTMDNNTYVGGEFTGNIDFVGSSFSLTSSVAVGFIGKISNDSWDWVLRIGNLSAVQVRNIVFDKDDFVYVTGSFSGTTTFESIDPLDNISLTSTGNHDSYLAKYDSDGNLIFAWHIAKSTTLNRTFGIFVDDDSNIILSGFWAGGNLELDSETTLTFLGTVDNWGNSFIIKLNSSGDLLWHTHISGNSSSVGGVRANGGFVNSNGDGFFVYVNFRGTIRVQNSDPLVTVIGSGTQSTAIFKLNLNGEVEWARKATNSSHVTTGDFISTDESGAVHISGSFNTPATFSNGTGDPVTLTSNGAYDAFVTKYDTNGTLVWAKNYGGIEDDKTAMAVSNEDIISTIGFFRSTMRIGNSSATLDTLVTNGNNDILIVNFDKEGNYLSSAKLGGTGNDEGIALAYDNEGNIIIGGYFLSPTINIGATQLTNGGNRDAFIARLIDIYIFPEVFPSCFGGANGSIGITISGTGTPPITYTVHLGANLIASGTYSVPFSVPDLVAGTYKITATDNAGKSKTKYVKVTQPTAQLSGTINVTHISTCFGAAEGSISITGAAGGWGTYEYSINGGTSWQSSNIFNNLLAGIYHVMIRDAAYPICAVTLNSNVEITQPTEISVMVSPTNITCNGLTDGQIVITATGGSGSYQYSINDGVSYQASNTFLNLAPGLYKIKVNDGFCIKSGGSVNIVNPDPIVVGSVVVGDISCNGSIDGTITVINVTGGSGSFEYSINGINFFDNGGVFTGLPADDYDLFIKDSYGCIISAGTYTINEPTMVVINSVITQNITLCHGDLTGEITISAAGGTGSLSYSIDGGTNWQITSGVFTGLAAGSYNINVKDANNCETTWASNPVVITQPLQLIISNVVKNNISCFGRNDGKITITATGGTGAYEYSLNGSTWQALNEFTNLTNNTYRAYVRDQNSCVTQWGVDIVITEPAVLAITNVQITLESHAGAANGSLTFTVSGGTTPYNFTLTPGGATNQTGIFTGLSKNTYSVNVTDFNGCVVDSTGIFLGITGIDDGQIDRRLNVYPNPSSGHFFIEIDNPLNKELIISIYNSLGQLVFSDKVSSLESFVKKEINLENQSKGTYMLRISGLESSVVRKLIIL